MRKRIRVNGVLYEAVEGPLSESIRIPSIKRYISKRGTKNVTISDGGEYGLFLHSYVKKDSFLSSFNCTDPNYYSISVGFGKSADFLSGGLMAELRHFFDSGTGEEMWTVAVKADLYNWKKTYEDFDSALKDFNAVTKRFTKMARENADYYSLRDFGRDEVVPALRKLGFHRAD